MYVRYICRSYSVVNIIIANGNVKIFQMNVSYYHLIMENRFLFNTTLMPMPASSDVCSAIDLLVGYFDLSVHSKYIGSMYDLQ